MISKKLIAGAVALALGGSIAVAPQASALPTQFTSPPTRQSVAQQACEVVLDTNITTVDPGVALKLTTSGVTVGVGLDEVDNAFVAWIGLSAEAQRIFESGLAIVDVENAGTEQATHSYQIDALKRGTVEIKKDKPKTTVETFNVTDVAITDRQKFSLKKGETARPRTKLAVDSNQDQQVWAWKVNHPTIQANKKTRVGPTVQVAVAPWAMESDNCKPLTPSETKSQPIIADGNEYSTGITVSNGSASDYKRLTGNVSIAGKKINGAKVRVDSAGKVFVTLPKGATGQDDNKKAAQVNVELFAQPRAATKNSKYSLYNTAQVLRVPDASDFVTQDSKAFVGSVPVAKFAPAYNSPSTVNPGGFVDVALKAQPGNVRGKAVGATYTVVNPPQGWTATPAKDGTLKVTAPKGAKDGDTATFNVKVTYADGSSDTINTVVKVKKSEADSHTPGYGETQGKPGAKVTLEQNNKLPNGSTFTITPGQNLGDWKPQIDEKTGEITVTIPGSAKPGDQQTILVDVKYPDGSVDKRVPAKVTVLNDPNYGTERGWPEDTVTLEHEGKVADGSTFTINPNQDLGDWKPVIDEKTGEITVTIPKNAEPGFKDILIDVTDPNNGGEVETVTARVIVNGKNGGNTPPANPDGGNTIIIIVYPNPTTPSNPNDPSNPGGKTIIEIVGKDNLPEGGKVTVGPNGDIYVIIPKDKTPTGPVTITIKVTNPDGSTEEKDINIVVPTPPTDNTPDNPNRGTTIIIVNPNGNGGGNPNDVKVPEGWTVTKEGDNFIITIPEGTKPGNYPIVVPDGKGGTTTVYVTVGKNGGILSSSNDLKGSSENLSKCFENLSSPSNPLLWLLPVGILVALGAPLAGPIGNELGKAISNVQSQMNIDIPNPFGNVGNDRPQPEFVNQIQAEAARLQQQFGPAVTQAAAVGLALVGVAAAFGILAAVCRNGGEDLASSKKDENAEVSSIKDIFKGEGSSNEDPKESGSSTEGSSNDQNQSEGKTES